MNDYGAAQLKLSIARERRYSTWRQFTYVFWPSVAIGLYIVAHYMGRI